LWHSEFNPARRITSPYIPLPASTITSTKPPYGKSHGDTIVTASRVNSSVLKDWLILPK
jgi:hypothetical protein